MRSKPLPRQQNMNGNIVWNAGGTVNFRFQDDPGDVIGDV